MKLGDIRIVDLGNSVIDEKLSKPKNGEYVFKSKRYIDYHGRAGRPNWWFRWIRHEPSNSFREVREARVNGYTHVKSGVDPYWPEGIPPNGDGEYIFSDVVLMKRPLADELNELTENLRLSRGLAQGKLNAYKAQLRAEHAELPPEFIDEIIGV